MTTLKELKNLMFTDYPDLVDVEDLQKMLCITRHTAYDLIESGALYAAKVGRKYRIPKIGVIEYLFKGAKSNEEKAG